LVWVRPRAVPVSASRGRLLCKYDYCKTGIMPKSIRVKSKRGRPATGRDPFVGIRLPQPMLETIETYRGAEGLETRSEAIRRLVELGLTVKGEAKPSTTMHRARRGKADQASSMAGTAIDKLTDQLATTEEQAKRKRRLIKGPSEFRDIRDRTIRKRDT
jgi:Arc/MetJ-type ribon-helix-helix transcriptional regulator